MGGCASSVAPVNPHAVDLSHFDLLKVVGKGGFGKVNAVTAIRSGQLQAIKRIEKFAVLSSKSHLRMIWAERRIMASTVDDGEFLVHLIHAFQSDTELFLVMPFMSGGDLRYTLKQRGRMSERDMSFYIAEVMAALECLHLRHIVYRDLKPDNILLDADGHCRVSDFGLAVILQSADGFRTRGSAGTRGYMAPETMSMSGYNCTVDFFSLGVLMFELIHGQRPWKNSTPALALFDVSSPNDHSKDGDMDGNNSNSDAAKLSDIEWSGRISSACRDVIEQLLHANPHKRIGARHMSRHRRSAVATAQENAADGESDTAPPLSVVVDDGEYDADVASAWAEVRSHPFFDHVDWSAVHRKSIAPPFIPDAETANCTADADLADQLLDRKPRAISEEAQRAFDGWDWNTAITPPHVNAATPDNSS